MSLSITGGTWLLPEGFVPADLRIDGAPSRRPARRPAASMRAAFWYCPASRTCTATCSSGNSGIPADAVMGLHRDCVSGRLSSKVVA